MRSCLVLPLIFFAGLRLAAQDVQPRVISEEPPVYPLALSRAGLRGDVTVRFVVDSEGRVRNPFVLFSTNPDFNQAAIDGVLKWRFEPGLKNGVPVNVRMQVPIVFQLDNMPNGGLEVYGVSTHRVDQSKLPPELRYDIPPKPVNIAFAIYPFELLRDGVTGTAEVKFLVSPNGEVAQAIVVKATRPEFGQALLAMLDEWKFQPGMKEGKPTLVLLNIQQEFSDSAGDVPVSDEAKDLLDELKKGKSGLCPVKDLDVRPLLLSQRAPVFPSALMGKVAGGRAVIEFLIDRYGMVQLPRIVSATDPAFGYAAVQGVSAWRFAPLTSHGKSVAVRASIPIEFTTPKPALAAGSISTPATSDNLGRDGATAVDVPTSDPGGFNQMPTPRFQAVPKYPPELARRRITGTVEVGFICDAEGRVRDAHVVSSSGYSKLDQAAIDAVSQWIFEPGTKDGHPVNVSMQVPIEFNLN